MEHPKLKRLRVAFRSSAVVMGAVLLAALASAQPALAADQPLQSVERNIGVMGANLQIRVVGMEVAAANSAIDLAIAEMQRIEDLMTDRRPSPLTALNEAAGAGPTPVPRELAAVISRSVEVSALTKGAFDITYAGVGRLWNFKMRPPVIPEAAAVAAALSSVGSDRIEVSPGASTVKLPADMRMGLDGIAKGYGVDRAMHVLREAGVENAIVNAGGELKTRGLEAGKPWEIAVKHPRDSARVIAVLRLSDSAMATSGNYERFFFYEGKRYHHILDPRTGYPAEGAMSATVIAPSAEFADALAMALCVVGPEAGLALIEGLRRVEAIVIDMAGNPHASSGLVGSLR